MTTLERYHLKIAVKKRLNKIRCEKSYLFFVRRAWRVLEPSNNLILNWHIKYLADIIQAETHRIAEKRVKTKDYIINIPPRSLKSKLFNVLWTPWAWTQWPHLKFINSSFEAGLATSLCLESRRLIESEWYQEHWGDVFQLTTDQNTKSWFDNDKRGMRRSASTRGSVTGTGADVILLDDPQNPLEGESDVEREVVKEHYGKTLYSRLNNQRIGLRVVIQQRLHEDDLTGHLTRSNPEKYNHICIPAEVTDDIAPKELRQNYDKDGLFFPKHPSFNRISLEEAKLPTNLGAYGYSGQMLQNPAPPEGGMFKRTWWRFWKPKGVDLPPVSFKDAKGEYIQSLVVDLPDEFDKVIDSWDLAFEGELSSDDVVGSKWSKKGASKFLLDFMVGKMGYKETKENVVQLRNSRPISSNVVVERSANGPALKNDLESTIPGIITIPPGRLSKEERARISDNTPYAGQVEAGNVYLPHPSINPKVMGWIEEHAKFPKVAQDGQVDSGGQAVNYLTTCKHVWPYYQPMNKGQYGAFKMDWEYVYHYAGIYMSQDNKMSGVACVWNRKYHHLYVYGEIIVRQPSPVDVAERLIKGMQPKKHRIDGIYGNKEMFQDWTKDTSRLIGEEMSLLARRQGVKDNIVLREPMQYNRQGSISLANLMFQRDQISVHAVCRETNRQMAGWYIENNKPVQPGFELCEALCHIVSELNRVEKIVEPVKKPKDYDTKVDANGNPIKEVEENAGWMRM